MLMGGGLVVPLSPNSRILAIPMPCILKCNLWLPNSLMHCIYPGQKLNITGTAIWFLCIYQKTHPCFCFIYSAPVLIAERKNALKILVLYVFQCWLCSALMNEELTNLQFLKPPFFRLQVKNNITNPGLIQEVSDNNCVYRNEVHHTAGERTQVLQDVASDPTLPRTKTVCCALCGHGEAVFFQVFFSSCFASAHFHVMLSEWLVK